MNLIIDQSAKLYLQRTLALHMYNLATYKCGTLVRTPPILQLLSRTVMDMGTKISKVTKGGEILFLSVDDLFYSHQEARKNLALLILLKMTGNNKEIDFLKIDIETASQFLLDHIFFLVFFSVFYAQDRYQIWNIWHKFRRMELKIY